MAFMIKWLKLESKLLSAYHFASNILTRHKRADVSLHQAVSQLQAMEAQFKLKDCRSSNFKN